MPSCDDDVVVDTVVAHDEYDKYDEEELCPVQTNGNLIPTLVVQVLHIDNGIS